MSDKGDEARTAVDTARELADRVVTSSRGQLLFPIGVVAATVVLAWQAATQWGTVETELASLRGLVESKHEIQTVQVTHLRDTLGEVRLEVSRVAEEVRSTKAGRAGLESRLTRVETDLARLLERVEDLQDGR